MVKLYTSEGCVWCQKMKRYLQSKNVDFLELDVNERENAEQAYKISGQNAIPVTEIGDRVIIGFDSNAVDEALKNT